MAWSLHLNHIFYPSIARLAIVLGEYEGLEPIRICIQSLIILGRLPSGLTEAMQFQ